jgi:hypothetical protein
MMHPALAALHTSRQQRGDRARVVIYDLTELATWEESKHPRNKGKFAKKGAAGSGGAGAGGEKRPAAQDEMPDPARKKAADMVKGHEADEHNQKVARLLKETKAAVEKARAAVHAAGAEGRIAALGQVADAEREHARILAAHGHESRRSFFLTYKLPLDDRARLRGDYARKGPQAEAWDKAEAFLREFLHKDATGDQWVTIKSTPSRAHYQFGTIRLAATDDAAIAVHEFGHHLERDPAVRRLANAFWESRFDPADEVNMREAFPQHGYAKDEVGNPDDMEKVFGDKNLAAYCGKRYPGGDTEIVSMGLEMLYRDPVGFAKADPEYFALIVGILQQPRSRE